MKEKVQADQQRELQQWVSENTAVVRKVQEIAYDCRSKALVHVAHVLDHEDLVRCTKELRNTPRSKRDPVAVAVVRRRKQQSRLLWSSLASMVDDACFAPSPAQLSGMRLFMPGCQTPHAPDDLDFRRLQRSQTTVETLRTSGKYFLEHTEANMQPTPCVNPDSL